MKPFTFYSASKQSTVAARYATFASISAALSGNVVFQIMGDDENMVSSFVLEPH